MMRGCLGGLKPNSHDYFDPVYIIVYYKSKDHVSNYSNPISLTAGINGLL